jgi:uncharacterized membrane protein
VWTVITTEKQANSQRNTSGIRFGFIDLLRGFALVVMIETHVINSYLPTESRHTWFFFWLTFFNGLVAPTFLFASGFSVMLQGRKQWDDWLHFRLPFWKQLRRLGFIALVAYYSHLQHFGLSKYLHPDEPEIWKNTLQVDILQCIVASLLVIHLLAFLLRRPGTTAWGALLLAVAAATLTPMVWARDFTKQMPLALALFMNPHGISLFPLFPWISFILCGAFVCYPFTESLDRGTDPGFMSKMSFSGILLIMAGELGNLMPFSLPGYQNFFTTSPLYVTIRLGCILIFCSGLYGLEKYLRWVPEPIRLAGQESLLVYGVHLWVIFGLLRGRHLGPVLGLEMGYFGCFLMSAAIIIFMLWLAGIWHSLKRTYPVYTKRAQFAAVLIMIAVFLLR